MIYIFFIYNIYILLSHLKNEILPFATTWIHLVGMLSEIMLSEISQTEKDIYHMISLITGM